MKINFKKISAITGSLLLTGMTMGVAAAANYPNPFVVGGTADVAIVYGTGTGVSVLDVIQAGNVQSNLQSYMGGSDAIAASITGESVPLFSGTKLYINDSLDSLQSVLTKSNLPVLLAKGSFSGNVDTTITQKIDIGSHPKVTFKDQPTSADDANYALTTSSTQANYIYNATATFGKAINFSHADSEGESITLFGMEFTVAAATDKDTLVLLKSAEKVSLTSDNPTADVTVGNETYTIELVSSSDSSATIAVTDSSGNTESKEISEAASKTINGITIGVTTADETNLRLSATVIAGSDKMTLNDGLAVEIGEQDTDVDGTMVKFVGDTAGAEVGSLTSLTISVYASESDKDAIKEGESFVDPVYGTFKLDFSSLSTGIDSTGRETISVTPSGNDKIELSMIDSRNYEKKFMWAQNTSSAGLHLMGAEGMNISIRERELIHRNEYVVIGNEDNGRLLKLSTVTNKTADAGTGYSDSVVKFYDVFSGEYYSVSTWASDGVGTANIGGKSYEIRYYGARGIGSESYNVSVDHADSTGDNTMVLFPTIQTSKGAKVMFYEPTWINFSDWDGRNPGEGTTVGCPIYNLSTIKIPDGDGYTDVVFSYTHALTTGDFNVSVGGGSTLNVSTRNSAADPLGLYSTQFAIQGLNFNISGGAWYTEGNAVIHGVGNASVIRLIQADGAGNIDEPALVIWEEKDDNTVYNAIIVELEDGASGDDGLGVDTTATGPTWINNSAAWRDTRYSNSDITDTADLYGTIVTLDDTGNDQAKATISYPDEQVYANLYLGEVSSAVTGGTTTTSGATQLGDILVKDNEVSSVSSKNLIIVGGSCINSAAANVLGGAYCGASFTESTGVGSGEFLIKGVSDAYSTGKIALVVAGYEAADTVNAAKYVRTQVFDTSKEYKGTSSTSATLVTTETA